MRNAIIHALLMVSILGILAVGATAQRKYAVIKNVVFKPGTSSSRISGALPSNREVHEYHFRVRAGQLMKVDLVSNDKNISFYIMTIPDGYMMTEDIAVRSFNDTLPDTGEYKLIVSTETRRGSRYALEVAIEPADRPINTRRN